VDSCRTRGEDRETLENQGRSKSKNKNDGRKIKIDLQEKQGPHIHRSGEEESDPKNRGSLVREARRIYDTHAIEGGVKDQGETAF